MKTIRERLAPAIWVLSLVALVVGGAWGIWDFITTKPYHRDPPNIFNTYISKESYRKIPVVVTGPNGKDYYEDADVDVAPDFEEDASGDDVVSNNVHIERIIWPNGGDTSFDDDCTLHVLNEAVDCASTNGAARTYSISIDH